VIVLVVVLVVTNLGTLGALAYCTLRPPEHPSPDPAVADALNRTPLPANSSSATRRVITVEVLNPIELATTRGRLAGIAGTFAPGLVRRIVYDQTIKTMRRQLVEERVVADVRLHTMRPQRSAPQRSAPQRRQPGRATTQPGTAHEPSVTTERADDIDPALDPAPLDPGAVDPAAAEANDPRAD